MTKILSDGVPRHVSHLRLQEHTDPYLNSQETRKADNGRSSPYEIELELLNSGSEATPETEGNNYGAPQVKYMCMETFQLQESTKKQKMKVDFRLSAVTYTNESIDFFVEESTI